MAFSPDNYVSPQPFIESGKATVPGLFKWHVRQNPSVDVFRFYTGNSVVGLTYRDVDKGMLRAARMVSSFLASASRQRRVVAVLAVADSVSYATVVLGIYRAGHVAFPISPRNSPAAVADLLRNTKTAHVLVSQDAHITALTKEALVEFDCVSQHPMPSFEELYPAGASSHDEGEVVDELETPAYDPESPALILHSSGSTNHPKPITWPHNALIAWGACQLDKPGSIGALMGCHGIPMFHAMGTSAVIMAAASGWVLCVFPPASPPTVPNPENVFDGAVKTGVQFMYTAPSFIEVSGFRYG
uniref:Alcohol oxidase n=1 Tax=Ganoderma boninense TaxID=34458 RepID=A0A5K1K896_9APHY|nr:Alcohol oxidase [Ganoderma boninense]